MRLYLVRHGQTDHNRDGLALGRADVPLNATGSEQALCLAEALADERFAAIYASPLQRTRSTAAAISARTGIAVNIEERLIEMDVGEVDGMPMADVRAKFPEVIKQWLGEDGHRYRMPGGESLEDVRERSWAFVEELVGQYPHEEVCAVTHNFVILMILTSVLGVGAGGFRRVRHGVAAISIVDVTRESVQVVKMNDACHLAQAVT